MDIMAHSDLPRPASGGLVPHGGRTPGGMVPHGGRTPAGVVPDGGRTPGGVVGPQPSNADWPALAEPTDFTVGVVDTGILLTWPERMPHPWMATHLSLCREDDEDRLADGAADELPVLGSADGHGTFVSGLILREAPRARVRMLGAVDTQVVGEDGLGSAEDRMVAAAIRLLAVNPRVQVINLSFGGGVFADGDKPPALLEAALADVDFDRVAVVASAGNVPSGERTWPAAFPGVIAVGAVDSRAVHAGATPRLADFSNHGSWVEAYAAGVDVEGPFLNGAVRVHADVPPLRAGIGAENELLAALAVDYHVPLGAVDVPDELLLGGVGLSLTEPRRFYGWATWSGTSFAAATVSGRIAAYAIEHGVTGAVAAQRLLADSPKLPGQDGVLIA